MAKKFSYLYMSVGTSLGLIIGLSCFSDNWYIFFIFGAAIGYLLDFFTTYYKK